MQTKVFCGRCGALLTSDNPERFCPQCLVQAGSESEISAQETRTVLDRLMSRSTTDAKPYSPATRLTPGQIFGGYRVSHLLGRGGMGAVYEAEQLETHRRVALKI